MKFKTLALILAVMLIISVTVNAIVLTKDKKDLQNITPPRNLSFLDPLIAEANLEEFKQLQKSYVASYTPLREKIEKILATSNGNFGIYLEDLDSQTWTGINERQKFTPASLLKITTAAAILKSVESGELSLDQTVTIQEEDLNARFGSLYDNLDDTFTIKELISLSISESDNTAVKALRRYLIEERWAETRLGMGLPLVSIEQSESGSTTLSPKEFSNVFRSLYLSGYLNRRHSNFMLSLLSQTPFKQGIPAGVPEGVLVAHKIGEWRNAGSVHDCGIVYSKKPYILCIMSENVNSLEGYQVINEISREVYEYIE